MERRTLRAGLNFTWTAWIARIAQTARIALLALVSGALAAGPVAPPAEAVTPRPTTATVKIIRTIPKSLDAFTEGLEIKNGVLYESTGLEGRSEIRTVDLRTGSVVKRAGLNAAFFGEGVTVAPSGNLVQLTWKNNIALVRDRKTLKEISRFTFAGEGWGLCYSDRRKAFVQSNGTSILKLRSTTSFKETGTLAVTMANGPAPSQINELECDGSSVFANIWLTSQILEISVDTGRVLRTIDASSLVPSGQRPADDVLNGIARLGKGRFLLTGKRWPSYFEVEFVDEKK